PSGRGARGRDRGWWRGSTSSGRAGRRQPACPSELNPVSRTSPALAWALQRNVPVLLRRVRVPLLAQHVERVDQPGARLARIDHIVDVAARGGDVRVGEALAVLGLEPRRLRL